MIDLTHTGSVDCGSENTFNSAQNGTYSLTGYMCPYYRRNSSVRANFSRRGLSHLLRPVNISSPKKLTRPHNELKTNNQKTRISGTSSGTTEEIPFFR